MNFSATFSMINITDILITIAGIVSLLSFLAKDMLWLRTLFMVACLVNAMVGVLLGLNAFILWNALYSAIHFVQIILLLLEKKPVFLPGELKEIYCHVFSVMTSNEFHRFWKAGKQISGNNIKLFTQGERAKYLLFLYKGEASVLKNKEMIATIHKENFIGEMSFLTGELVSADVIAKGDVECMSWSVDKLKKLKKIKPDIFMKIISILGVDLVHKLQQEHTTDKIKLNEMQEFMSLTSQS